MMKHHIIKNSQVHQCLYCNHDFSDVNWESHFEIEHHYKVLLCDGCGRKNSVKVDFHGSGHDHWVAKMPKEAATEFENIVQSEHQKIQK